MGMFIAVVISMMLTVIAPLFIPTANVEPVAIAIEIPEELEWDAYHAEAYIEYADEFTALFNSYETKRAKNGRLMIRQGDTGSFKFAKTK